MSACEEIRAAVEGKPPPVDHAAELTAALGLDERGRKVTTADIYGRGPDAIVVLTLDDGDKLRVPRFGDLAKPTAITPWLVTWTGIYRALTAPKCGAIAAHVHALAHHHAEADENTHVEEGLLELLRYSPTMSTPMSGQAERWAGLSALNRTNPASDAGEDRSAIAYAMATTTLSDPGTGERYVRTGWVQEFFKRRAGTQYSSGDLASRVQLAGWKRPNTQGRIKARNPTDGATDSLTFYVVDADWEVRVAPEDVGDAPEEASTTPRLSPVTSHAKHPEDASRVGYGVTGHNQNGEPGENPRDCRENAEATERNGSEAGHNQAEEPRRHVDGSTYAAAPDWMPRRDAVPS
jgi:hypothetical protein